LVRRSVVRHPRRHDLTDDRTARPLRRPGRRRLQELLLAQDRLTGLGIDHMLLATVGERSTQRGLGDRVRWIGTDAATWSDGLFDVVLCVGATHAFGGLADMLAAVRRHLRPGGQALVGDTI
jgi:cyclopropane fatty-acyl-phospholipid synthase-like methyltransferase